VAASRPRRVDGFTRRLGAKLVALRTARGWTQEEVAAALGYANHTTYNKLESGGAPSPSARRVLQLARLYEVSVDLLLRDELDLQPDVLGHG
jgi:transcriptional regulator with XRE-family HTH domain